MFLPSRAILVVVVARVVSVCVGNLVVPSDAYMGTGALGDKDFPTIKARAEKIAAEKQAFERLVLTKDEVCQPCL